MVGVFKRYRVRNGVKSWGINRYGVDLGFINITNTTCINPDSNTKNAYAGASSLSVGFYLANALVFSFRCGLRT